MERKLKALFDYQKFEGNYARKELDLEDLEWVSAAGTPGVYPGNKDKGRNPDGNC